MTLDCITALLNRDRLEPLYPAGVRDNIPSNANSLVMAVAGKHAAVAYRFLVCPKPGCNHLKRGADAAAPVCPKCTTPWRKEFYIDFFSLGEFLERVFAVPALAEALRYELTRVPGAAGAITELYDMPRWADHKAFEGGTGRHDVRSIKVMAFFDGLKMNVERPSSPSVKVLALYVLNFAAHQRNLPGFLHISFIGSAATESQAKKGVAEGILNWTPAISVVTDELRYLQTVSPLLLCDIINLYDSTSVLPSFPLVPLARAHSVPHASQPLLKTFNPAHRLAALTCGTPTPKSASP